MAKGWEKKREILSQPQRVDRWGHGTIIVTLEWGLKEENKRVAKGGKR